MNLSILHQTKQFVVCEKPQGIECEKQLPQLLSDSLGHAPFLPVHRLDKETGGVMVFAKNPKTAAFFSREIQNHTWEKTYLAVVKGVPVPESGIMEDFLFRDKQKNKSFLVKKERKGVKKAVLSYEVKATALWENQPVSLVEIKLQTGRTHQIRVQFSGRNMPLLGDRRYGGLPSNQLALWAVKLTLPMPDGSRQTFTSHPTGEVFDIFDEVIL
jgi:23S rRNA pseudouridine1911/1915/1917 synthase